jgi:predicted branched-subunit amino acid permease
MTMAQRAKGGGGVAFMLGCGTLAWIGWVGSTLAGRMLGAIIDDPAAYGLDFAFTATFLALLFSMWKGRGDLVPWLAGGAIAIGTSMVVPGTWYIIAGGLGGSFIGALVQQQMERRDVA